MTAPSPDIPSMRILLVDDDDIVADAVAAYLRAEGHKTIRARSGEEALDILSREASESDPLQCAILDVSLPGADGLETLRRLQKERPDIAVIMLTGFGAIDQAVRALRAGAVDYLTKPLVDQELRLALQRAAQRHAIASENVNLRRRLGSTTALASVVGADPRMLNALELIRSVAPTRTTVLMCGESGSGKSLLARELHRLSPRRDHPFVELSCGSIPETLLESELFGHVKGAFTGAHADKTGRFLAADKGSIFLDEINSASPAMQLKLLRVLQERRFEPVGSSSTLEVDVRVILASNQPLEALVASGAFRQDLYYRINVVRIDLPPLRDRPADVEPLALHFLRKQSEALSKQIVAISPDALDLLRHYPFPGNVRELENIIERAAVLTHESTITVADLPPHVRDPRANAPLALAHHANSPSPDDPDTPWTPIPLDEALKEPERRIILKALQANDWNRTLTAEQLGINRTTLYKKMKSLGIDRACA
ncbi:MAG: sigma-54-dependent transcriptional regulator [Phycisphaerales bacterium]